MTVELRRRLVASEEFGLENLTATIACERFKYSLMKNEMSHLSLIVDGLNMTVEADAEGTAAVTVEIRSVGGHVDLPAYNQPSRAEHDWSELIMPSTASVDGDVVWAYKEKLIHLQLTKRRPPSRHLPTIITHFELNVHPVNVHLTYEIIAFVTEYFDPAASNKKYDKYKARFLPQSTVVVDIEKTMADRDQRMSMMPQQKIPNYNTDNSKKRGSSLGIANMTKAIGSVSNYITNLSKTVTTDNGHHAHSQSVSSVTSSAHTLQPLNEDEDETDRAVEEEKDNGAPTLPPSSSALTLPRKSALSRTSSVSNKPTAATFEFKYIRIGSTRIVISYWGGGNEANVKDFNNLVVRIDAIVYQRKLWTLNKLMSDLRNKMIKTLLLQATSNLGTFLKQKLSFWNTKSDPFLLPTSNSGSFVVHGNVITNGSMSTTSTHRRTESGGDEDDTVTDEMSALSEESSVNGTPYNHLPNDHNGLSLSRVTGFFTAVTNTANTPAPAPPVAARSAADPFRVLFGDKAKVATQQTLNTSNNTAPSAAPTGNAQSVVISKANTTPPRPLLPKQPPKPKVQIAEQTTTRPRSLSSTTPASNAATK